MSSVCVAECTRATECGDGYACDEAGHCQRATGELGDSCKSEVECVAGLSCQMDDVLDENGDVVSSCNRETGGRPAGDVCDLDDDCRNGTCALGHCVDLCTSTRDCGYGTSCTNIPRIEASGRMFGGCLQSRGALSWDIPIQGPSASVQLPLPAAARSVSVYFSVEDLTQKVGATSVHAPSGLPVVGPQCVTGEGSEEANYYTCPVRHRPELGQSVLAMPSSPTQPLQAGVYSLTVQSQRAVDSQVGTAIPSMTAVIKLDSSPVLDLHFHFLNFDEHPCSSAFGGHLDAATAKAASFFQDDYLSELKDILARGGVTLNNKSYDDLRDHPDLDGLDVAKVGELLKLGTSSVGINVFFVRTLSPIGLQAFGPSPGPAGLGGTRQSGIVIGLDTLCYRNWSQLARLTAHEIAAYMGLYKNIELKADDPRVKYLDPLDDTDGSPTNLMFNSEFGGVDISPAQREILSRSAVLR
ncbi:MAG: hypothetical protein HOV81_12885 [Kofleriaceae bacterium]|nr:hypothetical protein [Kofleriaceae bacterium]